MSTTKSRFVWALWSLLCLVLATTAGCKKEGSEGSSPESTPSEPAAAKTLTIWWAQWAPADGLQELANEFGQKENVTVNT